MNFNEVDVDFTYKNVCIDLVLGKKTLNYSSQAIPCTLLNNNNRATSFSVLITLASMHTREHCLLPH